MSRYIEASSLLVHDVAHRVLCATGRVLRLVQGLLGRTLGVDLGIPGDLADGFLDQGCSTLWNAEEVEEAIEAADGGAEAVLEE